MPLAHALLGLINYKALSGYDLKSAFNSSINMFWDASLPQIYRTLHQMEKNEWVRSSIEEQNGKPNRKVYEISVKGKEELRSWLSEPLDLMHEKNPLMIKMFFGNQMDKKDLIRQLNIRRDQYRTNLRKYESVLTETVDRIADKLNAENDKLFWRLTVDCGIRRAKMFIEWCDSALELLEKE